MLITNNQSLPWPKKKYLLAFIPVLFSADDIIKKKKLARVI